MDRISVDKSRHRQENIGIAAQKTALRMRGYLKNSVVLKIRRPSAKTPRKTLLAPQSNVGVLRRMRRAVERDNPYAFKRANAELPMHVGRRLVTIGTSDEDDVGLSPFDPWMILFFTGPNAAAYGKTIPSKVECLRAIDAAIEEGKKPGRRKNVALDDLVVELIIRWANQTKSDLRQPRYRTGSSQRSGALADFIRELGGIWKVQLISTYSGSAMQKAILAAQRELGV